MRLGNDTLRWAAPQHGVFLMLDGTKKNPRGASRREASKDARRSSRLVQSLPSPYAQLTLFRQPEHLFGLEEPADRLKAERDQRAGTDPGKGARHQDRAQQPLCQ